MPTILHISDLHRTSEPRVENDHLLTAICSDSQRWEFDGIPWPDIVVVSGDLIQGAAIGTDNPDAEISAQYEEAENFLDRLATQIVSGDRSKVVIVPGNHDVNWPRAFGSMQLIDPGGERLANIAYQADSNLRWNWKNRSAYRITDRDMYMSRLEHFRTFRERFYEGLEPNPVQGSETDLFFAEYESMDLVIVGFASWYGNDCFCPVGEIDPSALTKAQELLATARSQLAVAVWHHGVVGGPRANDYMDQRVIHRLIDLGFGIGLHGHHHYPAASPFEIWSPWETSMAIASAGSLAVGNSELPEGERRQFNVVDIDYENHSITVHVRAMSSFGVFAKSYRDDFGGKSYKQIPLPPSRRLAKSPSTAIVLDQAATALAKQQYQEALDLADKIATSLPDQTRQIRVSALEGLGQFREVIGILNAPLNEAEAIKVVSLMLDCRLLSAAEAVLQQCSDWLPSSVTSELEAAIIFARRFS